MAPRTAGLYAVPVNHIQQRGSALVGLVLAASLALTGCSGVFGGGGTSGNGQSGASDGGSDGGTSTDPGTDAGTGVEGYEGKPATFPGDVPIIDGDVPFGVDLGTGWTVIVATDDIAAAYQDAEGRLTGAGFTSQLSSTTDDGSFGSFENDKYTVQVTATDTADYGPSVTYLVVLKG
ncbi:MAG: hypothetical protein JWR04_2973 [Rhodoglobus sp.]|nr:hypothetical protein [Rhodoglobus sp.]